MSGWRERGLDVDRTRLVRQRYRAEALGRVVPEL